MPRISRDLSSGAAALLAISGLAATAHAQTDTMAVSYTFPAPEVRPVAIGDDVYHQVTVEGLVNIGGPGIPVLPYKTAWILLPPGHGPVSVSVSLGPETEMPGNYLVLPGQYAFTTPAETLRFTPPDTVIYSAQEPLPPDVHMEGRVQDLCGFRILPVGLSPVRYVPGTGTLTHYESMTVYVVTQEVDGGSPLFRGLPGDFDRVSRLVDNPEQLDDYGPGLRAKPYDMVIITSSALKPSFETYAAWKTDKRGVSTVVSTTDSIYQHCPGTDKQERIRNFLRDVYVRWGIDYVLLGGDADIVPARRAFGQVVSKAGGEELKVRTDSIPCDFYFAELSGDWDKDKDGTWGEVDEADVFAELSVGRVPASTPAEVDNFFKKVRSCEEGNLDKYRSKVLFIGSFLVCWKEKGKEYRLWGGDYKDSTAHLFPPGCNITRLYMRDNSLRPDSVHEYINKGTHIVNIASHGEDKAFDFGIPGFWTTDVDKFTNTDYCLVHAGNVCNTANFTASDAIGEHFVVGKHGAFAYVGNTSYSWFFPGPFPSGPSHDYELMFHELAFGRTFGYRFPRVGQVLGFSKEVYAFWAQLMLLPGKNALVALWNLILNSGTMYYRWCHWSLTLLGDPSTPLRNRADLLIRDHPNDEGAVPTTGVFWQSPDIHVHAPSDHEPAPPEYLVEVRVWNVGCQDAGACTVRVYWADQSKGFPGPGDWNPVGQSAIKSIVLGKSELCPPIAWVPPGWGDYYLLATVETQEDPAAVLQPTWDNNVALRSVRVGPLPVGEVKLTVKPRKLVLLPHLPRASPRDWVVTLSGAPAGATAVLQMGSAVGIADAADPRITQVRGGCLAPGHRGWTVTLSAAGPGEETSVRIPGLSVSRRRAATLKLTLPEGLKGSGEARVTIQEEVGGETTGGMDYFFPY